jgi:hypothetical protein
MRANFEGRDAKAQRLQILEGIKILRSRQRKLERDNPYVWSIIEGFKNDIAVRLIQPAACFARGRAKLHARARVLPGK